MKSALIKKLVYFIFFALIPFLSFAGTSFDSALEASVQREQVRECLKQWTNCPKDSKRYKENNAKLLESYNAGMKIYYEFCIYNANKHSQIVNLKIIDMTGGKYWQKNPVIVEYIKICIDAHALIEEVNEIREMKPTEDLTYVNQVKLAALMKMYPNSVAFLPKLLKDSGYELWMGRWVWLKD